MVIFLGEGQEVIGMFVLGCRRWWTLGGNWVECGAVCAAERALGSGELAIGCRLHSSSLDCRGWKIGSALVGGLMLAGGGSTACEWWTRCGWGIRSAFRSAIRSASWGSDIAEGLKHADSGCEVMGASGVQGRGVPAC